jgi:hypothetical protein
MSSAQGNITCPVCSADLRCVVMLYTPDKCKSGTPKASTQEVISNDPNGCNVLRRCPNPTCFSYIVVGWRLLRPCPTMQRSAPPLAPADLPSPPRAYSKSFMPLSQMPTTENRVSLSPPQPPPPEPLSIYRPNQLGEVVVKPGRTMDEMMQPNAKKKKEGKISPSKPWSKLDLSQGQFNGQWPMSPLPVQTCQPSATANAKATETEEPEVATQLDWCEDAQDFVEQDFYNN